MTFEIILDIVFYLSINLFIYLFISYSISKICHICTIYLCLLYTYPCYLSKCPVVYLHILLSIYISILAIAIYLHIYPFYISTNLSLLSLYISILPIYLHIYPCYLSNYPCYLSNYTCYLSNYPCYLGIKRVTSLL